MLRAGINVHWRNKSAHCGNAINHCANARAPLRKLPANAAKAIEAIAAMPNRSRLFAEPGDRSLGAGCRREARSSRFEARVVEVEVETGRRGRGVVDVFEVDVFEVEVDGASNGGAARAGARLAQGSDGAATRGYDGSERRSAGRGGRDPQDSGTAADVVSQAGMGGAGFRGFSAMSRGSRILTEAAAIIYRGQRRGIE